MFGFQGAAYRLLSLQIDVTLQQSLRDGAIQDFVGTVSDVDDAQRVPGFGQIQLFVNPMAPWV